MLSFDLHTHSSCSDGELSPEELAREAAERKVSVLALTDHDTSSGTERASTAARKLGVCLVPGIEFSTKWHHNGESFEIHIVGLEIDPRSRMLKAAEQAQRERRTSRILGMAEKLEALGFTGITDYFSGMIDQGGMPTRKHLGQYLESHGAGDYASCFNKYLVRGAPAYCQSSWMSVGEAVDVIHDAGGLAVFAHPLRYQRLTGRMVTALAREFKELGGDGIEVTSCGMGPSDSDRLAELSRSLELYGSMGFDFHDRGSEWRTLGKNLFMPSKAVPIWTAGKIADRISEFFGENNAS